jgi:predicted nuclease with TOPRIM domain
MNALRTVLLSTLKEGVESKNPGKLEEFVNVLWEEIEESRPDRNQVQENKSRLREQHTEIMRMLDLMDKRFEQVDKRFEELRKDMDKRFEELREDMNRRFEQVDKRFEDIHKRFTHQTWFIGALVAGINIAIALIKGL